MLGENIRALRKARGLSQQELAERLHVVRQTVSKWEQGLSVPDADMLVRLAECLEVSVEELLGAPKPESTAPLEPQAVLADKLSALTGQLAEQNHRRRRFWKWVAIAAGICGLLLLAQLVLTLLMLGYGLPANSSIGIIAGAVLAFARALGEYGATSMVAGYTPGKTATISTTVYQLWQTNNDVLATKWVLVNIAISAVVLLAVNMLERRDFLTDASKARRARR